MTATFSTAAVVPSASSPGYISHSFKLPPASETGVEWAERSGRSYYNENDPKAAAWLRALIAEGAIAPGDVDERSIAEVQPHEIYGYSQHHFFAGIGGWSLALRLAGWRDDEPAWTGSCPCQPFSDAGKRLAENDPRHLWPQFRRLIAGAGPTIVFGEQVASSLGRVWLAGIRADLEALGYAVGGADLCAAGVAAPHRRQRLYWLAHTIGERCEARGAYQPGREGGTTLAQQRGELGGLADTANGGCAEHERESRGRRAAQSRDAAERGGAWDRYDLLPCRDGKTRRVEPGTFPLAHGVSGRVGLLRGYGNAIVPELAAEFIQASREALALVGGGGAER